MNIQEQLKEWGTRIQSATKIVDDLADVVRQKRQRAEQEWRHIPAITSMQFALPPRTQVQTGMQEMSWLNGGEDVHFQGVMTSVLGSRGGSSQHVWEKTDAGYSIEMSNGVGQRNNVFVDFAWNIRVLRNGQQLMSPANNSLLMSSTQLRKDRAGKVQWWTKPLVVKAGDNIIVQVRPLRVPILPQAAPWATPTNIQINFALYGVRTGALYVR